MASPKYFFFVPILCQIILLLLISHLPNILSQDSSPTIAQCTPSLLLLIPCTTFVQGTSPSPGSACCGNLKQLYSQEPHCLCLFLNGTNLRSLPINRTLALQLPALCSIQVNANMSACLGEGEQVHMPATSPHSQVSFGTKNNSSVIASPAFSVPPRPTMMGIGFGSSKTTNLKTGNRFVVVTTIAILLFMSILY